jgi:diguanylate cyclase (GGDEF)-like protein
MIEKAGVRADTAAMGTALRERLGLLPAPAVNRRGEPDAGLKARSLMFLFLAGALVTLGSLLLPGAVEDADRARMVVMGASALAISLVLFIGFDRLSPWVFPIFLACGTLLIEWTVYASGDSTSPYVMFWFWLAIYAFYFLSRWQALGQLLFIALAYAALLSLAGDAASAPIVRWTVTTSALIVAGAMIGLLKERVDKLIAELRELSRVDSATGLINRLDFIESLGRAVELSRRTRGRVTLVLGEVDGQPDMGRVGHAFIEAARRSDVPARIGDKTFAIIAAATDDHGGFVLAERVQEQLRQFSTGAETTSFGVASFPEHADGADELVAAAHDALTEARALGEGRVVTHGAMAKRRVAA